MNGNGFAAMGQQLLSFDKSMQSAVVIPGEDILPVLLYQPARSYCRFCKFFVVRLGSEASVVVALCREGGNELDNRPVGFSPLVKGHLYPGCISGWCKVTAPVNVGFVEATGSIFSVTLDVLNLSDTGIDNLIASGNIHISDES